MKQRPKRNDQEVLDLFYKRFAAVLIRECTSDLCRDSSLEDIESDLRRAGYPDSDGYRYARQLEDRCDWLIIAEDIEVLDNAFLTLSDVHDEVVSQWVINNGIAPKLKDGESCEYKGETGTAHHEDRHLKFGEYLFRNESWIIKHGNQGGIIINFEDIEQPLKTGK